MLGPELELVGETGVLFQGRRLVLFAGNDYHRLSRRPEVAEALCAAGRRYGLNAAGSRMTTANHPLYLELERKVAETMGTEAAALVASGYQSNTALLQAVSDQFSRLLLDERAHVSLQDAAAVSGLPVERFPHLDADHAAERVRNAAERGERVLIATDGVFASTGEVAPLHIYAQLAERYQAQVLVDDAHGVGVLGQMGRGTPERYGVPAGAVLQTGTLSKAFGGFGGFVVGPAALIEQVRSRSAVFVGGTPLPLPVAAASIRALELFAAEPERIARLQTRAQQLKHTLREWGFTPSPHETPICSLAFTEEGQNRALYGRLLEAGIYPSLIRYPGAPNGSHFRFTLSSEHTNAEIALLTETLRAFRPDA